MYKHMKYKNLKDFENNLKAGTGLDDVIIIKGKEFTQINYDMDGRQVVYHTAGIHAKYHDMRGYTLEVNTSNRYNNGYNDVSFECYNEQGADCLSLIK